MRRPFEALVQLVDGLEDFDDVTLGELGKRWDESMERVMDAMDASKMLRGIPTYLPFPYRHQPPT